jgi:hypothetical protein
MSGAALAAGAGAHAPNRALPGRIFISYHRGTPRSRNLAGLIHDRLPRPEGGFLDERSVHEGDAWAERIYAFLFECDAAIVLVSEGSSTSSEWVPHEAALLCGRFVRWRDLALIAVAVDVDPGAVGRMEGPIRTLGRIQITDARQLPDEVVVERVLDALADQWAKLQPRLRRHDLAATLLGLRAQRAERFVRRVAERLPRDPEAIRAILARLALPLPPRDAQIDVRLFFGRLLLTFPDAERAVTGIADAGYPKEAARVRAFLEPRGLLDEGDLLDHHLAFRFAWSVRRWLAAALALAVPIGAALRSYVQRQPMHRTMAPGAFLRAGLVALLGLGAALVLLATSMRLAELGLRRVFRSGDGP